MSKNNLLAAAVFFVLLSFALSFFLYRSNASLQRGVDERDALIAQHARLDTVLRAQDSANQTVVEKYISDCNILVDGKEYSTDALVDFMNGQIERIQKLEAQVGELNDSLRLYRLFRDMARQNLQTDFRLRQDSGRQYMTINVPDSLTFYKRAMELARRDYGIQYRFETKDNHLVVHRVTTTADSALVLFKYYRDKITRDSAGVWHTEICK